MNTKRIKIFRTKEGRIHPRSITLLNWCTTDRFRVQVEKMRACDRPAEKARLKGNLPCATPSILINGEHSGYIVIDVDGANHGENLDYTPAQLKEKVCAIENVAYCGFSCSGEGVWALIPIQDPKRHREHFSALEIKFERMGITINRECKNVKRLSSASYDPEPYINENAIPFGTVWVDISKPDVKLTMPDFYDGSYLFSKFDLFYKFDSECDVVSLLIKHGWKVFEEKGERIYLTRPDKDNENSGEWHKVKRLFFCNTIFSAPFDPYKVYNPTQTLAVLEFDNDMKRVYRYLTELYDTQYKK